MKAVFYPHENAFELNLIELQNTVRNLIDILKHCNRNGDTILGNDRLEYITISIGNSKTILFGEILENRELLNKDKESYSVLENLLRKRSVEITNTFLNTNSNGYLGLDFTNKAIFPLSNSAQYVYDEKSWFLFHKELYLSNPSDSSYFTGTKNTILPFIEYTKKLITNPNQFPNQFIDIDKLYIKNSSYLKTLGIKSQGKESFLRDIGKQIAELNFYNFNKKVSDYNNKMKNDTKQKSKIQKNNKKSKSKTKTKQTNLKKTTNYIIYESRIGANKVYLSLDLKKGAFEVCNSEGIHQGEYLFNGNKSGEAELGHSILIPPN